MTHEALTISMRAWQDFYSTCAASDTYERLELNSLMQLRNVEAKGVELASSSRKR